jgi:hypothetical protein
MTDADRIKAIWTGLSRNLDAEGEAAIKKTSPFWKNHDQGAATVLVAAFDPTLDGKAACSLNLCQANSDWLQFRKECCCMTVKCSIRLPTRQT